MKTIFHKFSCLTPVSRKVLSARVSNQWNINIFKLNDLKLAAHILCIWEGAYDTRILKNTVPRKPQYLTHYL